MSRLEPTADEAHEWPELRVHVLSEFVFCPRAGQLARGDTEAQEEEPALGPRLDRFLDYDAERFQNELQAAWSDVGFWFSWLGSALLIVLVGLWLGGPVTAVCVSYPALHGLWRLADAFGGLIPLARAEARRARAVPFTLDPLPTTVSPVNWWSLRQAGFDCFRPGTAHRDPLDRLVGRPWRILTYETAVRIPVVRKHRGGHTWGPQHVVRLAAYCRLLEQCEGASAPFGLLVFPDSDDVLLFPNTGSAHLQLERALADAREAWPLVDSGRFIPPAPSDHRCAGCHRGRPRKYVAGQSETNLGGKLLPPVAVPAPGRSGVRYHSDCGDRFGWTPPHADAIALGIATAPVSPPAAPS